MCGRYTLTKLADLLKLIPWLQLPANLLPRFNIAPTQDVPVVTGEKPDQVQMLRWGLIPSWAKDPAVGNRMINARAETLDERPAFRTALRDRRCLVLADGFYEWRKDNSGGKTPVYFRLRSGEPFAFAGLWDRWRSPDGSPVQSCTIITTRPNALVAPIHDRMPAILNSHGLRAWLDPDERDPGRLLAMLGPCSEGELEAVAVSRRVNNPRFDAPQCIEPLGEGPISFHAE